MGGGGEWGRLVRSWMRPACVVGCVPHVLGCARCGCASEGGGGGAWIEFNSSIASSCWISTVSRSFARRSSSRLTLSLDSSCMSSSSCSPRRWACHRRGAAAFESNFESDWHTRQRGLNYCSKVRSVFPKSAKTAIPAHPAALCTAGQSSQNERQGLSRHLRTESKHRALPPAASASDGGQRHAHA